MAAELMVAAAQCRDFAHVDAAALSSRPLLVCVYLIYALFAPVCRRRPAHAAHSEVQVALLVRLRHLDHMYVSAVYVLYRPEGAVKVYRGRLHIAERQPRPVGRA